MMMQRVKVWNMAIAIAGASSNFVKVASSSIITKVIDLHLFQKDSIVPRRRLTIAGCDLSVKLLDFQ